MMVSSNSYDMDLSEDTDRYSSFKLKRTNSLNIVPSNNSSISIDFETIKSNNDCWEILQSWKFIKSLQRLLISNNLEIDIYSTRLENITWRTWCKVKPHFCRNWVRSTITTLKPILKKTSPSDSTVKNSQIWKSNKNKSFSNKENFVHKKSKHIHFNNNVKQYIALTSLTQLQLLPSTNLNDTGENNNTDTPSNYFTNFKKGLNYNYDYNSVYTQDTSTFLPVLNCYTDIVDVPENINVSDLQKTISLSEEIDTLSITTHQTQLPPLLKKRSSSSNSSNFIFTSSSDSSSSNSSLESLHKSSTFSMF
ncbi:hypothetical protein KAFR_0C00550 [Kazachstania africana CBS 2517]|uniref:Nitrogen regulatory protein areA GATA-like domain-containing protein n=1 Tax=Kazachstania africana (strain ATCC 22294 / BCRC 22015 / CBS 2517 / CECT 1963 / NBRC 1671 / NRRL Y-8276) TaxID=1071382 RepID=H2ARQ0_KAZAF|nr:hypothetical protein KAFR_0C00550 [Kazachstania africana CBS 2517]CCF57050.1 hypothetical protein KAFR_0C00550 [Kazachstania africana CBS 2517]